MASDDRYWIEATPNEENRLAEVTAALNGVPLVAIGDDTIGGVIGYANEDAAEDLVNKANAWTMTFGSDR